MGSLLSGLLKGLNKGWLKQMLLGAGLTLGAAAGSMVFINQLIELFKTNANSIPADILSLAHIAGFDYAISIILGAIVASVAMNAGSLALRKT